MSLWPSDLGQYVYLTGPLTWAQILKDIPHLGQDIRKLCELAGRKRRRGEMHV